MQGRNLLHEAGAHIGKVGKRPLVLWDARVKGLLGERVLASLKAAALETMDVEFRGDSTRAEAARVAQIARDQRCLLYTSPSPRDRQKSRMPSSA